MELRSDLNWQSLSWENIFQGFRHYKTFVIALHYIIGLQNSHCLSANHNPELRCELCTGVTLFAPVVHFLHWYYIWPALLSANQNRITFSCVLCLIKSSFESLVFNCYPDGTGVESTNSHLYATFPFVPQRIVHKCTKMPGGLHHKV